MPGVIIIITIVITTTKAAEILNLKELYHHEMLPQLRTLEDVP